MKDFVRRYLDESKQLAILDVGSVAVREDSSTYKSLMSSNWKYVGLDIEKGRNVDLVIKDPYNWREIEDETFDAVISGQALEHIKYPWLTMQEIVRVTKSKGLICIVAPSSGFEHRFPIDCYRFYPDGLTALAEFTNIEVLKCYCNNEGIWKDTVMIGRKK